MDLDKHYIYIKRLYSFMLINYSYSNMALFIKEIQYNGDYINILYWQMLSLFYKVNIGGIYVYIR